MSKMNNCFLINDINKIHQPLVGEDFVILSKIIQKFSLQHNNAFICSSNIFNEIIQKNYTKIKPLTNDLYASGANIFEISKKIIQALSVDILKDVDQEISQVIKQIQKNKKNAQYVIKRKIINNNQIIDTTHNNAQIVVSHADGIQDAIASLYLSFFDKAAIVERQQQGIDHLNVSVVISVHQLVEDQNNVSVLLTTVDKQYGLGVMTGFVAPGIMVDKDTADQYLFSTHTGDGIVPVIQKKFNKKIQIVQCEKNILQTKLSTRFKGGDSIDQSTLSLLGLVGRHVLQLYGPYQITLYIAGGIISIVGIDRDTQKMVLPPPNVATLNVNTVGTPIVHTSAVSSGIFFSKAPHKDVLFLDQITVQDISKIVTAGAIIVESKKIQPQVISFLRERGIPCLVGRDCKEIEKQKNITIYAKDMQGYIYSGYLNFEYKEFLLGNQKVQTQLYSSIYDVQTVTSLKNLPIQGVYYDLSNLFIFHNIHPSQFFVNDIDASQTKQIMELTSDAKNRLQVFKTLIKQSVSILASVLPDKKIIVSIPWFTAPVFALLQGHTQNYQQKYLDTIYQALKEVITEYQYKNIVVISDYQKTPEHFELFTNSFVSLPTELGLHIDVYKNEMLSKEYANLATYAILHQKDIEQEPLLAKKIISSWKSNKGKSVVYCTDTIFKNNSFEALMQRNMYGMVVESDIAISYYHAMSFLEKTIGNKGKKTHIPITMMIAAIGVFFAISMLIVAGYNGVRHPDTDLNSSSTEISPAELRKKILERADAQKADEFEAQRSILEVSDFAQFSMEYPSWWRVTYWNGGVTVTDPLSGEFISIFRQLIGHPIAKDARQQIIIDGKTAQKFTDILPKDGSSIDIVEIPVADNIIEINATSDRFTELLNTFTFIDGSGVSGRNPTHWDVREGAFCVQMITYARKTKGDTCEVFSTPCDVPEHWEVCDSNDV